MPTFAARTILSATQKLQHIMEAETKEIIKEKEYVRGRGCGYGYWDGDCYDGYGYRRHGVDSGARALGIVGTVAGGLALLRGARGGLFGGSYGTPENVNINANMGGANGGHVAPTAFEAYSHECEDVQALTNEIWGIKVNTQNQMYAHRSTDINEKFQLYKSQVDADFGLYKSTRDSFDALTAKHNADVFALYKGNRDGFDVLANRIADLEKKVAVNEAVRPYQDKLLQCSIDRAFTASVNYTDRKTCRAIYGVVGLPSTPTVTVLEGANPYGCNCTQAASTTPAA